MSMLSLSGRFAGLAPFELAIAPGECIGLSGPSGAGKSRLLRAIADLDPHDGEIRLDGVRWRDLPGPVWRTRVGLLPARPAWWHDTVGAHFAEPEPAGLADLGLAPEVMRRDVHHLSSGESQRLALLRLLQNRPDVLLLDEPTASLDRAHTERTERLVRAWLRDTPACAIWVSHDPEQLRRVSDRRLAVLADGRIEAAP